MKCILLFFLYFLPYVLATETDLSSHVIPNITFPSSIPNYAQLFQTVGNDLYILGNDTNTESFALIKTPIDSTLDFNSVTFM